MKLIITAAQLDDAARFALRLANTVDPSREQSDRLTERDVVEPLLRSFLPAGEDAMHLASEITRFRDVLRLNLLLASKGEETSVEFESDLSGFLNLSWRISLNQHQNTVINCAAEGTAAQQVFAWAALGYFALREKDQKRFKICKAAPCEELYIDETKPARQRFCCKRCANRFNVAQFRSRKLGGS